MKDRIEVTSGLGYGDRLIIEGQSVIRDGDKVTAEELAK